MNINQLVGKWEAQKILFVKESTLSAYKLILRKHVLPIFGEMSASDITNAVMQDFVLSLITGGLSQKSALDIFIVFKTVLNVGAELGACQVLKFNIKYPSNTDSQHSIEVYTEDEQKQIIGWIMKNITYERLGVLITLCTGLRIGEIAALRWRDVDTDNHCFHITSTMQRVYESAHLFDADYKGAKTKVVIGSPKTSDSNRIIPIAKDLMPILKTYKKIANENYFITTGTEKSIEPRVFRVRYKNMILNDIGLKRCIKFHGLRHSFATRMIANGADLKTTSTILGHSKVEMTMNLYVHPTAENKQSAINKSMKNLFK